MFRASTGKRAFPDRTTPPAQLVAWPGGDTLALLYEAPKRELVLLDAKPAPTRRPLLDAERSPESIPELAPAFAEARAVARLRLALRGRACSLGTFVFPREACVAQGVPME